MRDWILDFSGKTLRQGWRHLLEPEVAGAVGWRLPTARPAGAAHIELIGIEFLSIKFNCKKELKK